VLIDEEPWQHAEALARTAALMTDESVPAIFEGAFEHDGIRIRVDVLERLANGAWGLREVKSTARPKDNHYDDVAIQLYVLNGSGVALSSIELIHVNSAYMRGPDGISWLEFFARVDVTDAVAARLAELPARLPAMRECLGMVELPNAEPGTQCSKPYSCEFWDRCTADKPTDWVAHLPRLSGDQASQLKALGIAAISSIPPEFPLTAKQMIIRAAWVSGRLYVSTDIQQRLQRFGPPACYLDFEAIAPTIPLYEGTRPFQALPFQWSLHTRHGDGNLRHQAFLADGANDPRREFAENLIEALAASDYPTVVYSSYERTQLTALAREFPDLSVALNGVIARLADLLPIVRSAVYLPEFGFSNSLKSVAPALCRGFGYDDLDGVADGLAASSAFHQIASGVITAPDQLAKLQAQLLAYCERDTLAMVEMHQSLMQLKLPEVA
jgi:hypothetical protein